MEPTVTSPAPDKRPQNRPYERVLLKVVRRLTNQLFLFVIAITVLLVVLAMLATALGTSDLRFFVLVIAFLALTAIMIYFITEIREKVEDQQKQINQLVKASMSPGVFRHLAGVTILEKYIYRQNDTADWQSEFYDLKHRGFIEAKPGKICEFKEWFNGTNITENVKPTQIGLIYVELRKKDIPKEWLDLSKRKNLNIQAARDLGLEFVE